MVYGCPIYFMIISVRRLKDILDTFDDDLKIKFLVDDEEIEFQNVTESDIDDDPSLVIELG